MVPDKGGGGVHMAKFGVMAGLIGGWVMCAAVSEATQTIYPSKDGTLADGGSYGPFDGVVDNYDWTFNQSSYEGSITRTTPPPPELSLEHRVVWEYDLNSVAWGPWVSATLTFTLRGAPIWPFPDVSVHVYSYPADLVESVSDYSSGPTLFQGAVTVVPYQSPTVYTLDVNAVVGSAMLNGTKKVAFRFQIDPNTLNTANQAFIDALDTTPATKPYLTISPAPLPGDFDGDQDVDLADYVVFADCLAGPGVPPAPTQPGVTPAACLAHFDFDHDSDVDVRDFGPFQYYLAITHH